MDGSPHQAGRGKIFINPNTQIRKRLFCAQEICWYDFFGIPQNGGMQSQIDLALNPDWGNTARYVTKVTVPKGTTIYVGTAAPQVINGGAGILLGGGNQIFIPEVDALWFGN